MERLTKRDTDGQAMMDCEKCKADWTGKHGKPMVDCTALYCRNRLKDRLAAYEDTRLTPERCAEFARADAEGRYIVMRDAEQEGVARLRELAKADKEGRVVVLPCKVGDVVYGFYGEKTILPMVAKWIETDTDGWCIAAQYVPMAPRFYRFSDFGKTVFLTREEAEKALEVMKDE